MLDWHMSSLNKVITIIIIVIIIIIVEAQRGWPL